jgi:CDP-diacylglycerol---serine O-phosphatidyltransferase
VLLVGRKKGQESNLDHESLEDIPLARSSKVIKLDVAPKKERLNKSSSSRKKTSKLTEKSSKIPEYRSKGIFLLPNLFTIGNIFAGFFAIVSAMNNNYVTAAIAIFIAMVFDLLDGRVARLINAQSEFGAQLDSLADIISFGITPALVIYNWSFIELKSVGWGQAAWLGSFLYVACVALRLAKFNTQTNDSDPEIVSLRKKYFFGLPCPAAAAVIASMLWISEIYHWDRMVMGFIAISVAIVVALCMVSNILYLSFKDLDLKKHVGFALVFCIVLAYMIFFRYPAQTLFGLAVIYFLSGPVIYIWKKLTKGSY